MVSIGKSDTDNYDWLDLEGHRVIVKPVLSSDAISTCVIEVAGEWVALCGTQPQDQTLGWVPQQSVRILDDLGCFKID